MNADNANTNLLVGLYRRAFDEFGAVALWNLRSFEAPTPEDALVVARALRIEGNLRARELAEQIEQACCASLEWAAD